MFDCHRDPSVSNFNSHLISFALFNWKCITDVRLIKRTFAHSKVDNSKATIHHTNQLVDAKSGIWSDALANLPVFRWNGRGAVVLLLSAITRCPQTEREREISQAVGH